jgi:DNA-directed RNA polymerase subunit RPC12/RpoP
MKTFKLCSNPDCSPLAPMVGTILKRKSGIDPMRTYRCRACKSDYDADMLGTDVCPKCGRTMKLAKVWWYECPKCGRRY